MSFAADEDTAAALFDRCLEAGINHFDTADVYGNGRSEEILGALVARAGCRDRVVIATKAYFPAGADPNARGSSRYHLVRSAEASLRRLATDRIDLFYLHRFDDETDLEETFRALDDLVHRGLILYPALSNFAAWQVMKALGVCAARRLAPPVCVQPMFNLVKRQVEVEILPMCGSERLGVIPYSPTGGGLLTGKFASGERPASGRLVENKAYRYRYGSPDYYQVAERFTALAKERGHHPAAMAIAWVAAHPAVTSVLLGARTLEQLEPLLGALAVPMDDELRAAIGDLAPAPAPATDRNEEGTEFQFGRR
jgi:aryl-alcohol dehydrogenase-like predicted oxidoreductase